MKKMMLAAGVTIVVAIFAFIYKVGEDMMSLTRCGCHYRY